MYYLWGPVATMRLVREEDQIAPSPSYPSPSDPQVEPSRRKPATGRVGYLRSNEPDAGLDLQLAIHGEARGTGGAFGEGFLVNEDYLAVLDLDGAVALELAHDLRDRFAGRGDHVR